MITSVHTLRRLASATGLAALVVAIAIPVAFAGGKAPILLDGRSPDTRDAAVQAQLQGLDPAIATAMRSHQSSLTSIAPRSSDTLDVAIATAMRSHQSQTLSTDPRHASLISRHPQTPYDLRRPDTIDAAANVNAPVATPVAAPARTEGSDWSNLVYVLAAIGAGFLLVGFGGHAAVTRKTRGQSTGSVRAA